MIFKLLYLYFFGNVDITVEGFFIERFINICKAQNIVLWKLNMENGSRLNARISKSDFKTICGIAKKTSCRISLDGKNGLPFVMKKYRKRKIFAIALLVIAIFCFTITRFIWNIEIQGNNKISKEEILSDLAGYGIDIGKFKFKIDLDMIKNEMRMKRNDLAWLGIDIKGTNVIVTIVESIEEPEIIDESISTNIIANKNGVISKMVIRNGTARVNVGDEVSVGDLLVEGVMEGKYTGIREVNSDADIYLKSTYKKEKKEAFIQEIVERTGKMEKNVEIYINNFKIFFNKGVPNFKNCDTIRAYKKVKLFSNYYIPIEIVNVTNFEQEKIFKTYTEEELTEKITNELQQELNQELNISNLAEIKQDVISVADTEGVTVKVIYEIEEKIGTKE